MSRGDWHVANTDQPCPACGKTDRCKRSADGRRCWCWRTDTSPAGWTLVRRDGGGALFTVNGTAPTLPSRTHSARTVLVPAAGACLNWEAESVRCAAALSPERLVELAAALGVRSESLGTLAPGWATPDDLRRFRAGGKDWEEEYPDGAFTFPERDGAGRIVGLGLRTADGRKGSPARTVGAKRGLIFPKTLATRTGIILAVEGASDVAAAEALGLAAVGRSSAASGGDDLARLCRGRKLIIVGENDQKPSGEWPGRDGAERVAMRIATSWNAKVAWALPPHGVKDLREWLGQRVAAGLDLDDEAACASAGAEFMAQLATGALEAEPQKQPPQSERIVQIALEHFRLGVSQNGDPFAVRLAGPNHALMFRGSRDSLKSALAREFRNIFGRVPNATALADALVVLEGEACAAPPEQVYVRIAEHEGQTVLDLGAPDGRAIVIGPDGWQAVDTSPVLFHRSPLIAEIPEPQRGGDIETLRTLLNVTEDSWLLALGWLVAAFIPSIPHPILMLGGEHGTGKSTAARMLVRLFDPSSAPLRSQPRDVDQWAVSASGCWGVVLDNISHIPPWLSDTLCKAVTGDGWIKRTLYTDAGITILSFRRVIALTSIDVGSLRGDLGDRLLIIDLERIPDERRRTEADLEACFNEIQPKVLGALLDIVSGVLRRLPRIVLKGMPRMADFARVLAAMDEAIGTDSLNRYLSQRGRIAAEVLESDAVAAPILKLMTEQDHWTGTATQLHELLAPEKPGRGWPKDGRVLSGRLTRLAPALRANGVSVEREKAGTRDRTKLIILRKIGEPSVQSDPSSADDDPAGTDAHADAPDEDDDGRNTDDHGCRPAELRPPSSDQTGAPSLNDAPMCQRPDASDDADDKLRGTSADASMLDVPEGWTPTAWCARLLQMADRCEATRPDLAAAYRAAAERLKFLPPT